MTTIRKFLALLFPPRLTITEEMDPTGALRLGHLDRLDGVTCRTKWS
jgi:hypothetical protein